MRVVDKIVDVEPTEVPYFVWTKLHDKATPIRFMGDQVCIGDSNYSTVEEIRAALDWYAYQFGGKIKWEKL